MYFAIVMNGFKKGKFVLILSQVTFHWGSHNKNEIWFNHENIYNPWAQTQITAYGLHAEFAVRQNQTALLPNWIPIYLHAYWKNSNRSKTIVCYQNY